MPSLFGGRLVQGALTFSGSSEKHRNIWASAVISHSIVRHRGPSVLAAMAKIACWLWTASPRLCVRAYVRACACLRETIFERVLSMCILKIVSARVLKHTHACTHAKVFVGAKFCTLSFLSYFYGRLLLSCRPCRKWLMAHPRRDCVQMRQAQVCERGGSGGRKRPTEDGENLRCDCRSRLGKSPPLMNRSYFIHHPSLLAATLPLRYKQAARTGSQACKK